MNTKLIFLLSITFVLTLSSCATKEEACMDLVLASEQIKECQALQRQIAQAKGRPIIRTELERRYEQDCVNVRYYRDDQKEVACGGKLTEAEVKASLKKDENH